MSWSDAKFRTSTQHIAPTVHLNGTSDDELLRQLEGAVRAMRAAIEAVEAAAPNARDYFAGSTQHTALIRAQSYGDARDMHEHHVRALVTLRDAYVASIEHVHNQIDARSANRRNR